LPQPHTKHTYIPPIIQSCVCGGHTGWRSGSLPKLFSPVGLSSPLLHLASNYSSSSDWSKGVTWHSSTNNWKGRSV
jgi:hypothetical protein